MTPPNGMPRASDLASLPGVATQSHDEMFTSLGVQRAVGLITEIAQQTGSLPVELIDAVQERCMDDIAKLKVNPDPAAGQQSAQVAEVLDIAKAVGRFRADLAGIDKRRAARAALQL